MNTASIVQKLWNYCNVLRDDGMSYGDYVEQLTYLLFLKMADERTRQLDCCSRRNSTSSIHGVVLLRCSRRLFPTPLYLLLHPCSRTFRHPWRSQAPYSQKSPVPSMYSWPKALTPALSRRERGSFYDGDELFDHYRHTLEALGNQKGLLGLIFNKSQSNHSYAICIQHTLPSQMTRKMARNQASHMLYAYSI
jgi:type I restriction enzyme M protein